ncbi:MAG: amidohydrolase family protein [Acidimicrobiales bacterium]
MYDDLKVLDVHAHVSVPPVANTFALNLMASNTAMASPLSGGPGHAPFGSVPSAEQFRETASTHVAYIDERGIDVQIIGPRPFMTLGWMQPHLIGAWSRYVNDMIHQQCEMFPGRFLGACQLPQHAGAPDAAHCLGELQRCVDEYQFVATYVSPDPDGRRTQPGMHDQWWFPLYERCEELGLPIIVHGTNSVDPRYAVVPHNYQLGFLTEQYLATQFLGHGPVFDHFPGLKVVVCHCGGALNRFIPTDFHLPQRDTRENLFYDTCGYDLHFLEAAIKQRGADQMCFGVEAPGSGRAVRPETGRTSDDLIPVLRSFEWLSEGDRRKIVHHNPARVCPALAKV